MDKFFQVLSGAAHIAKDAARRVAQYKYSLALAESPCHDDLYMVSFPKSGSTWVDFLIANVNLAMSGDPRTANFFNIHNFVADIHFCRQVRHTLPFPGFRIIKSHSEMNPFYKNVIYIIRDPRDVMVSYYHFLAGIGSYNGDMGTLIRSNQYGISAWCEHVRSWMESSSPETRFVYLKYEDFKSNPMQTLKTLYGHLGCDIADEILQSALDRSSFENMKLLEQQYGYGGRSVGDTLRFMRKGRAGGWKEELEPEDAGYIGGAAKIWLNRFGYEQ